jgi:uncharacterized protein YxjI
MKKIFELHQKITFLANEYQVLEDTPDGQQALIGYAKQKRLTLREQFTLFKDEAQTEVVATSAARSVLDLGAIYDIAGADGKPLAAVKKDFRKSLLNSTWTIYDPTVTNPIFSLREKSQFMAIFRRLWEFLPYISEAPFPIKYHFVVLKDDQVAGEYIKITRFRDHYALYLDEQSENAVDKRAWMITAVLLDAMQSR